jgi:hypothetical protein
LINLSTANWSFSKKTFGYITKSQKISLTIKLYNHGGLIEYIPLWIYDIQHSCINQWWTKRFLPYFFLFSACSY